MSCYGCGSSLGSALQLCPTCIEKRKTEKSDSKQQTFTRETKPDLVYDLSNDIWVRTAFIGHFLTFCFVFFLFAGPMRGKGILAAFLFAAMTSTGFVSTFIGIIFWARLLMNDFMWAIGSLILPCLIYRYVVINWDDRQIRVYFYTHITCAVLTWIFALMLANTLGKNIFEVFMIYDFYIKHGEVLEEEIQY